MRITKIKIAGYETRKGLYFDAICGDYGVEVKNFQGIDDANYYENVNPNIKCISCGESSNSKDFRSEFDNLSRKLIKYINDNHHPHTIILIDGTSAQIFEGVESTGEILDYIKD